MVAGDLGEQMQIMIAFYLVCLATTSLVPVLVVPRRTFPRSSKTNFMWSISLVLRVVDFLFCATVVEYQC